MSPECGFFNGQDGVKCQRTRAYPVLREALKCQPGDLIELVEVVCKEEGDSERRADCPAFLDLETYSRDSQFAIRT